mmetsp:Transcript_68839/g.138411  ORF Transcript_68839/g.138411 Transcript_68839/m.138411 type:complete len:223 (+) Transcript_68839:462-1130(+)
MGRRRWGVRHRWTGGVDGGGAARRPFRAARGHAAVHLHVFVWRFSAVGGAHHGGLDGGSRRARVRVRVQFGAGAHLPRRARSALVSGPLRHLHPNGARVRDLGRRGAGLSLGQLQPGGNRARVAVDDERDPVVLLRPVAVGAAAARVASVAAAAEPSQRASGLEPEAALRLEDGQGSGPGDQPHLERRGQGRPQLHALHQPHFQELFDHEQSCCQQPPVRQW